MKASLGNFYTRLEALRHVRRFSRHYLAAPQNVMEHSFLTAMIGVYFAEDFVQATGCRVDITAVLEGCLWHDAAEAMVGDVPHDTKRSSHTLMVEWNKMEAAAQKCMEDFSGGPRSPKPDTLEGFFVKLADWVELLLYEKSERCRGNHGIRLAADRIWVLLRDELRDRMRFLDLTAHRGLDWYEQTLRQLGETF